MTQDQGDNLTKRAAHELRQRIMHGSLRGGERLYEVALAEELSISRTPVREAMSRLAEEGLLERAPSRGFIVRSFSLRDVIDAIELRGVLEGTAARMAAERGVGANRLRLIKEIITELDTCFDERSDEVNFDNYSELNATFHAELAEICDSTVIQREIERVLSLPFASPSAFVLDGPDTVAARRSLIQAQAQHKNLVSAIENREGSRAEAIAREHARIARANLELSRQANSSRDTNVPGLALIVS